MKTLENMEWIQKKQYIEIRCHPSFLDAHKNWHYKRRCQQWQGRSERDKDPRIPSTACSSNGSLHIGSGQTTPRTCVTSGMRLAFVKPSTLLTIKFCTLGATTLHGEILISPWQSSLQHAILCNPATLPLSSTPRRYVWRQLSQNGCIPEQGSLATWSSFKRGRCPANVDKLKITKKLTFRALELQSLHQIKEIKTDSLVKLNCRIAFELESWLIMCKT